MPFTTHVFLLICVSIYAVAIARVVHVDVNAPWARYDASFTAEISEFLAHESPELFWKYTNSLCAHPSVDDVDHTVAFNTAQSLLAPALHPLLDTVLGLSVYAPTVQFFQSIASNFSPENNSNASTSAGNPCDGNAWAVVYPGRRIACNVQTLNAHMIKSSSGDEEVEGLLQDVTYGHSSDGASWDHTFGVATSASLQKQGSEVHVVVYGAIGSSSFCALHAVASSASSTTADAVSSASIVSTYAVRHAFPGMLPKANSTRLQGFGVFLDIKNMEYKNVDDSSTSVAKEETSSQQTETEEITIASFPEGEQVAGVILSTIIANNPDVDLHDMSVLRDDLIEVALEGGEDEDGDMSHMKLWRMKDLGVQTVHSILKSEVRTCAI